MITEEKLRIYQRYAGDNDGFARVRNPSEHLIISDQDWAEIDQLLQRLFIEKAGLAAESFCSDTARIIAQQVPSPSAVALLREMS